MTRLLLTVLLLDLEVDSHLFNICAAVLSLLPLLLYISPVLLSQRQGRQSLLMRIYLTQYSMRENPVYTVQLRDSGYPLACSATCPEELPGFGDSAGEITKKL